MNKNIVFITGRPSYAEEPFYTQAPTIQSGLADLYDYHTGEMDTCIFRRIVCKLSERDAILLYNSLTSSDPLIHIFTNCEDRSNEIVLAMERDDVE